MATQVGQTRIVPLTTALWEDLVELFGPRGADGGCWCMFWRLTAKEYSASSSKQNKQLLKSLVEAGAFTGLLAYQDGEPAGWCGLSPRSSFARLERSRIIKPVDGKPVWSIVCLFVARNHRGRNLVVELLEAATRFAAEHGAPAVESYPVDLEPGGRLSPTEAYAGTVDMFRKAGFYQAAKSSATRAGRSRVIMRYDVGRRV